MAVDVQLLLDQADTVVADKSVDYIEVEGGYLMWAVCITGAMSGGSTTCDIRIQQSLDAGSNYYMCPGGKFQTLGPTNDNVVMRIPVFIGLPTTATNKTRVRVNYDVGGSSPSYLISFLWLEPVIVGGAPGNARPIATDLYALVAST